MSAMEKKTGEKKKNFFSPVAKFFNEVKSEMKKVVYPNGKQVRTNTIAVIVCVLVIGIFIALLDWGFATARDKILLGDSSNSSSQSGSVDVNDAAGAQTPTLDEEGNLVDPTTGEIIATKEEVEEAQKQQAEGTVDTTADGAVDATADSAVDAATDNVADTATGEAD